MSIDLDGDLSDLSTHPLPPCPCPCHGHQTLSTDFTFHVGYGSWRSCMNEYIGSIPGPLTVEFVKVFVGGPS